MTSSEALETLERFDRISDVYDETREPLGEGAIEEASRELKDDQCSNLLEVGIGTGRIAKPLSQRGFKVVGVDFSRGMLARAREKGLENLVVGDANWLPFEDKKFDAVVLAHVLHLLKNPAETFGKVARAARKEVVIFVRKRDFRADQSMSSLGLDESIGLRQTFTKVAQEMGYEIPAGPWNWRDRFRRETEFLSSYPPTELITIQDETVVTTLGDRLSLLERRFGTFSTSIPDDLLREVVRRMRSTVDLGREVKYRRVEQMAIWRLPPPV